MLRVAELSPMCHTSQPAGTIYLRDRGKVQGREVLKQRKVLQRMRCEPWPSRGRHPVQCSEQYNSSSRTFEGVQGALKDN